MGNLKYTKEIGLINGRHQLPVSEYVFEEIKNIFDFKAMEEQIHSKLKYATKVTLYVTGLTAAVSSVVAYCVRNDIELTLMHYDTETTEYIPQTVHRPTICAYCNKPSGNGYYCKNCGST